MAAKDLFKKFYDHLESPASRALAIVPDNSTDITFISRGVYVGTGGDIVVDMADSGTITFVGVANGSILPIRVKRIRATGTTASDIVVLY